MAHNDRPHAGPVAGLTLIVTLTVMMMVLAPLAGSAGATTTTRLSASENVGAALAWSNATFTPGSAPEVLLARDNLFADSLSSGAAQARISAPLLLTSADVVDPRVLLELERLGTDRVIILGGEAALRSSIDAQLEAAGFETERVFGATRIETAIAVADRFFATPTRAVIARAFPADDPTQAFADSLATGAFAAATNTPLLYTQTETLSGSTRAFLEGSTITHVVVAGGERAVSAPAVEQIRALGIEVERAFGSNRYSTATAMAAARGIPSAGRADRVVLTEGNTPDAWADGFAAALQAAGSGTPLVLSANANLPEETRQYLADAAGRIALVCGPFVESAACNAAADEMGNR